ncbi:putative polysaccharide biosynthesis protein [Aureibacillus halotolerans]|uniref:O-antigen/teichoic acid export membrane protein n=1 Tax=Aureibacillus halotolerans TaxID=1508390 RepID=A0A4R6TX83_9BACI|nr:polysaccharide biosynthesis protein [Aureibacillus halotolerans]TDQ36913.1 O-antigen/teichoic acid export membrane protein [Aureibacillus halotolerans]
MAPPSFLKSAIVITVATLISKILGSVFLIPLQNIAGDEVFGIFRFVYPFYMVALILSVAGIPIAISKLISEARAQKSEENIRAIFLTSSILAACFGIISFTFMYFMSGALASWFWNETAQMALAIVSVTLLLAPYMAVYRGFFQGFDEMRPTAFSQVFEQCIRAGVTLVVAYVFVQLQTEDQTLAGYVMYGSVAGVLVSLVYLRVTFQRSPYRPKVSTPYSMDTFVSWGKRILSLSIPVAIGTLTMALLNLVDSLTIPNALSGEPGKLYGLYGRGVTLVQIATVFSSAIILPLIPRITQAMVKKKQDEAKSVVARSLKMAHLVSWPAALGLAALAVPINIALFTDNQGSTAIALLGISSLFTSFSVLTTGILQGLNRAKAAAVIILLAVVAKAVMNSLLVQGWGIEGAAAATTIIYMLIWAINAIIARTVLPHDIQWRTPIVCFAASVVMSGVIATPWLLLELSSRSAALLYVIVAVPIGAMVYAGLVIGGKALRREEFAAMPYIGRFFAQRNQ